MINYEKQEKKNPNFEEKNMLFSCKIFSKKISKKQPSREEIHSSEYFSKCYTAYVIL